MVLQPSKRICAASPISANYGKRSSPRFRTTMMQKKSVQGILSGFPGANDHRVLEKEFRVFRYTFDHAK
jgi:hypothetical protein